jgi:hypothetical protein
MFNLKVVTKVCWNAELPYSQPLPHLHPILEQNPQQRLLTLKNLGLARYDFLTQIPLTEANVACVMRFSKIQVGQNFLTSGEHNYPA